jgi:anthranilate phosphoribosyltransferase
MTSLKDLIRKITEGADLSREEAGSAMNSVMSGEASDAQISALLVGLKMKGETVDELLGFVDVMRERSIRIRLADEHAVDLCGTGGDNAGTFNISTVASFIVSGSGVTVAKHGNRSVSSSCGSADVLKALGVNIELPPEDVERCINAIGIGFLFAPLFHPAMKYAAKTRADLGVKTCFNILGPLTNPAGVRRQLVGTFSPVVAGKIAEVLARLDTTRALVVHSADGLDEVSLASATGVHDVAGSGEPRRFTLEPEAFNLPAVSRSTILGSTPEVNAGIARAILAGKAGPHRHVALANAALGILASGKTDRLTDAVAIAVDSVDSGRALLKLDELREFSRS